MLTLTDLQAQLAGSANPMQVTLVKITTYTDHDALTTDELIYWASVPIRYKWSGSTVTQWEGVLDSVSPVARSMSHIPSPKHSDSSDGITLTLANDGTGADSLYGRLDDENLLGALVEVASLLVDWSDETDAKFLDQSALDASSHIVRWRGEIAELPAFSAEGTSFDIVCITKEPQITWGRALVEAEVSEKHRGIRYPVPIGAAKRVELVQRVVGHFTTLVADLTDVATGNIEVTDASGFPDSGTFGFWIGKERLTGTYVDDQTISITARAVIIDTLESVAVAHNAGAMIIEDITAAKFVYSGVLTGGLEHLYARSPSSGELVRIDPDSYSFTASDVSLDTGQTLGVVSFTQRLWGKLIQTIQDEARITTQASLSGADSIQIPLMSYAHLVSTSGPQNSGVSVGPDEFGAAYDFSSGFTGAFRMWAPDSIVPNQTRGVSRFRLVARIRIEGNGTDATVVKCQGQGNPFNNSFLERGLFTYNTPNTTNLFTSASSSWVTPSAGTTLADIANTSGSPESSGPAVIIYIDQANGSASTTEVSIIATGGTYWDVELEPLVLSDAVVSPVQALGFNLDLYADVIGACRLASPTSNDVFDDTTGWTPADCTLANILGGSLGIKCTGSGTDVERSFGHTGLSLDVEASKVEFEYLIPQATLDALTLDVDAFQLKLTDTGVASIRWSWAASQLYADVWTKFSIDVDYDAPNIAEEITFPGAVFLDNIVQLHVYWKTQSAAFAGEISFRLFEHAARTTVERASAAAEWWIEDIAGLPEASTDDTSFAAVDTNIPLVDLAGDLREAGETFSEVLASIGYETRTNYVLREAITGDPTFFAFCAEADHDWPASALTLVVGEYGDLVVSSRHIGERPTEFSAVYGRTFERSERKLQGFTKVLQANATINDISAKVPTSDITDQQTLIGVRPTDAEPYLLLDDSVSAIDVWSYYVAEALRGTAKRFTIRLGFRHGYAIEVADILTITPTYNSTPVKVRVTGVVRPFNEPTVLVALEEVT